MHRFTQISFPILFITVDILWLKIISCDPAGGAEMGVALSNALWSFLHVNIRMNYFGPVFVWAAWQRQDRWQSLTGMFQVLPPSSFHICETKFFKEIPIFRRKEVTGNSRVSVHDAGELTLPSQLTSKPIRFIELRIYVFKDHRKSAF